MTSQIPEGKTLIKVTPVFSVLQSGNLPIWGRNERLRIGQKVEAKRQKSFEQLHTNRGGKLEFRIDSRETGLEEPRCVGEEMCREYSHFHLEAFVTFFRNVDKRLKSQAEGI